MYILVQGDVAVPYSIAQLRKDNPNVSFPREMTDEQLANRNIYPVAVTSKPEYNLLVQSVRQSDPQNVNGSWVIDWAVENLPQEDAANNVRNHRNDLLAECDWTQLADATVNSLAWANYRQALRDIPQQDGFPYNVNWPTKP